MFAVVHDEVPSSSARKASLALQEYDGEDLTPSVQVHLPQSLRAREFLKLFTSSSSTSKPAFTFPALQNWFCRLHNNLKLQDDEAHPFHKHPYRLREIDVQAVDWFCRHQAGKDDKLGFMKIQARIETDPYVHDGENEARADWLPGAVFLRGGSVAILIIVQPEDAVEEDEKYVVLTIQPRIAAGSLAFTEIPAGMLDGDSFKGSAASEIEEEANLKVQESDLVNLSELALQDVPGSSPGSSASETSPAAEEGSTESETEGLGKRKESTEDALYPSPGACDEFIPILLCQKRLTRKHMDWLRGKATGLRDEGEKITLKLVPLSKAWRHAGRDAKALAALSLYENLNREGSIPHMPDKVEDEPEEFSK